MWGTRENIRPQRNQGRFIPTCVGNSGFFIALRSSLTVHPHVCGELSAVMLDPSTTAGSSPRVWGTLIPTCGDDSFARFIPTCVGNAPSSSGKASRNPVHPHVCGERSLPSGARLLMSGSSPRVWGTQLSKPIEEGSPRFIPTCVGNSRRQIQWLRKVTVHPHVCGELK